MGNISPQDNVKSPAQTVPSSSVSKSHKSLPYRACLVHHKEQYHLDKNLLSQPRATKYLVKVRTEVSSGRHMAKLNYSAPGMWCVCVCVCVCACVHACVCVEPQCSRYSCIIIAQFFDGEILTDMILSYSSPFTSIVSSSKANTGGS